MRKHITTIAIFLFLAVTKLASANEATSLIHKLKAHYQNTSSIKAFSLTHSYLGQSDPFQSWDFEAPTRYKAFKVTDIDIEKQHYYQNVVHHYTGGLYFDEVHFQNSKESLRYERNGISLGKSAIQQNMDSFNRYKNLTLMNLDFFAIRPTDYSKANEGEGRWDCSLMEYGRTAGTTPRRPGAVLSGRKLSFGTGWWPTGRPLSCLRLGATTSM